MQDLKRCIARSVDSDNEDIVDFLPELFEGIDRFGSDPDIIAGRMETAVENRPGTLRVLDLGCGKGEVALMLAREFDVEILAVDAVGDFVVEAKKKAAEQGLLEKCLFKTADLREVIKDIKHYDGVILGSIGPVLGTFGETLKRVAACINADGFLILDDGFVEDEKRADPPEYLERSDFLEHIHQAGYHIEDRYEFERDEIEQSDQEIFGKLEKNVEKLKVKYPEKSMLFDTYLQSQKMGNEKLENDVTSICMLLTVK